MSRSTRQGVAVRPDELGEGGQAQSIFLRGLLLGTLIGAVIAGSAVWERRRTSRSVESSVSRVGKRERT